MVIAGKVISICGVGIVIYALFGWSEPLAILVFGLWVIAVGCGMIDQNTKGRR